ncbi:DUF397 domain-containing protein [Streptomyces sp. NPDC006649]|uniref:DUF397 domain-containing protein n=1 Tax=Streptomyces sp. NPDC006649 TaxID=3156896 RepID=UPI00325437D1
MWRNPRRPCRGARRGQRRRLPGSPPARSLPALGGVVAHQAEPVGNCLEIATHPAAIHVRDSKNTGGPTLTLAPAAWSVFAGFVGGTGTA